MSTSSESGVQNSGLISVCRIALAAKVRAMGRRPTKEQKLRLIEQRNSLQHKIDLFEGRRSHFFGGGHREVWEDVPVVVDGTGEEWDDVDEDDNPLGPPPPPAHRGHTRFPEQLALSLPSTVGRARCELLNVTHLCDTELRLREGDANDTLHQVRISVGQKSFLFLKQVRPAKSQQTKTRAWAQVTTVDSNLKHHARVYSHIRKAMISLGASDLVLGRFRELRAQDLKVSTAVANPKEKGGRKAKMAWFFSMNEKKTISSSKWMKECEHR